MKVLGVCRRNHLEGNALAGCEERALAGISYMSPLGLRTPKDRNGCELIMDFNHSSSTSGG